MNKHCTLQDIRALFIFYETFEVEPDGTKSLMVDRPAGYGPKHDGFICTNHPDTKFIQWKAVMVHLGMEVE